MSNAPPEVLGYALPAGEVSQLDQSAHEAALAELKQKEIDMGIMQLESLLNTIVDKDFDKFEIYTLRNILAVGHDEDIDLARWVRLEHYRDLKIQPSEQQITPEDVQLQRRKRHETAKLNLMLKEEHARNAAVIEQLQSVLGADSSLGFLTAASSQQASYDMGHVLAQLPMIQQSLADLKAALAQPASRGRVDEDSSVVKRRRYLEQQSLKALELRGLTAQKSDQPQASKRQVNKDEVEGLEAVVQALGGADGVPD